MSAGEIARYYWITLPEHFFVVVPVALLLSLMYAPINTHGTTNSSPSAMPAGGCCG